MHRIEFFAEDFGHEAFLRALIERLVCPYRIEVEVNSYSVRGGYGTALSELRQYLTDLQRGRRHLPDLIVVARDANCKGYPERKQEMEDNVPEKFKHLMVYAIPDPHIERWLLLDSSAFKTVLGRGCAAPDYKCERDRYKRLLVEAIRGAGISPLLGGMEHAEDIVHHMDLRRMEQMDVPFAKLLTDLNHRFKEWGRRTHSLS